MVVSLVGHQDARKVDPQEKKKGILWVVMKEYMRVENQVAYWDNKMVAWKESKMVVQLDEMLVSNQAVWKVETMV